MLLYVHCSAGINLDTDWRYCAYRAAVAPAAPAPLETLQEMASFPASLLAKFVKQ